MKFVVIGGAGAMGKITVRDLAETLSPEHEVVVADFHVDKAKQMISEIQKPKPKLSAVFTNAKDPGSLRQVLNGAFVAVNCAQYQFNVEIMQACLDCGSHYVDLGGLFHVTRKQQELDSAFREKGLTAVLGMGAAPGITNVLARHAADDLDEVSEIHCLVAGVDRSKYSWKPTFSTAYSIKTILEEFSFEPAVYTKGEFKFITPMTLGRPHAFPPPVGKQTPMYTIHSEVATLPLSYKDKGCRESSFRIAFHPDFVDRVKFIRDVGLASHEEIEAPGGVKVKPIDVVNHVIMAVPAAKRVGPMKEHEVVRSVVKGKKRGKKITVVADCHSIGMPQWGFGLDVDTGCPPSIAAQMLALGEITSRGALPPEKCVPSEPFFKHLKKRRMNVKVTKKAGWGFLV